VYLTRRIGPLLAGRARSTEGERVRHLPLASVESEA
jgi:hypothetical protein